MRIFLSGFMGSGKSTVGPRVAARLGLTFVDLDRLIQVHDGRSIPRIFAEEGEEAFRQKESDALQATVQRDDVVVALGGGALVDDDNRALAQETGSVVYLKVDPETILDRIADEAAQRPLLQDNEGRPLSEDRMRRRVERMLDERQSTYEDAHQVVDAGREIGTVVEDVCSLFSASVRL